MTHAVAVLLALFAALAAPPDVSDADLAAFPPADVVARNVAFAEAHLAWVADRGVTHGWGWGLKEHAAEARRLATIWHHLAAARGTFTEVGDDRKTALRQLRKDLGNDAYYAGRMPPPAPFWNFSPRD